MYNNYYIVGDIHGNCDKLKKLFKKIFRYIKKNDLIIFLGDYIDRGNSTYEVIEYLLKVRETYNTFFLMGNHEKMLNDYLKGELSKEIYYYNGGEKTIRSYTNDKNEFIIPIKHTEILNSNNYYYESEDFIAVHAGLPPKYYDIKKVDKEDLLWIRSEFFYCDYKFKKTVIFGHTVTDFINRNQKGVLFDESRNIIGIDTGAAYGGKLSCIRWPDKKVFKS